MVYLEAKSQQNFESLYNKYKNQKVIIYISSNGNHECLKMTPIFKSNSSKHQNIAFIQVDIIHCYESKILNDNVSHVPLFIFFKKNVQIDSVVGANIEDFNNKLISFEKK